MTRRLRDEVAMESWEGAGMMAIDLLCGIGWMVLFQYDLALFRTGRGSMQFNCCFFIAIQVFVWPAVPLYKVEGFGANASTQINTRSPRVSRVS